MFIDKFHGQSVHFQFGHIVEVPDGAEKIADPAVEIEGLPGIHRVLEAEERHFVPKRKELFYRSGPDALGWRIRRYEFGVLVFEINEFAEDPVVLRIADFRLVESVVTIVVVVDKLPELFDSGASIFFVDHGLRPPVDANLSLVSEYRISGVNYPTPGIGYPEKIKR
jgi:hypothetical protein